MGENYRITPEGTRDLIFEECTLRRELEYKTAGLFRSRGFSEVVTPEIEFLDVFNMKTHHMEVEGMYKLSDRKGRLIALRPDSTMPIARLASTRLREEPLPLRLFYNQKVYRVTPSLAGHSDEVLQSGIEIIGASGKRPDLEVIETAVEALDRCAVSDYRLEIGHIAIFNRLAEKLGLKEVLKEDIRQCIESKNYPALNDLVDSNLTGSDAAMMKQFPRLFGSEEVFDQAITLFRDKEITETVKYLQSIYNDLRLLGLKDKITVDLGIVNRANYYTGVLFRGYISGFGQAVLSGGRYDNLLSEFGMPCPATGFGINLDAVLASLTVNLSDRRLSSPDVLVFAPDGFEMMGLIHAKALIAEGKTIEYSVAQTLEQAEAYAAQKQIRLIAVVTDSVEQKTVDLGRAGQ